CENRAPSGRNGPTRPSTGCSWPARACGQVPRYTADRPPPRPARAPRTRAARRWPGRVAVARLIALCCVARSPEQRRLPTDRWGIPPTRDGRPGDGWEAMNERDVLRSAIAGAVGAVRRGDEEDAL